MFQIQQPNHIIFGKYAASEYSYPNDCLIITSKGAKSRVWLEYSGLKNQIIFDIQKDLNKRNKLNTKERQVEIRNPEGGGGEDIPPNHMN